MQAIKEGIAARPSGPRHTREVRESLRSGEMHLCWPSPTIAKASREQQFGMNAGLTVLGECLLMSFE